ncbi:hypothetical protein ILYODFUR_015854, partial [Ilyodon furcidens]
QLQQSSSESDDTIILGPTPAAVIGDISVPELKSTNSVILHKQMLGYTEEPPSSSEISEEDSLAAKDPKESSSADVNDRGESSSADVNDRGESSIADVTVMTLKKKEDGCRVYNKRNLQQNQAQCERPSAMTDSGVERTEQRHTKNTEALIQEYFLWEGKNPYMFGRPQKLNHFRGSDIIREMAQSCAAKHPGALSSTKLRKHMATTSKVLNLTDNEMDDLADFLGHDIRVHCQCYRWPEGTTQLAKISKVLLALER